MKEPKYKIGDTVVVVRRWFLWFREPVLCEIVGGRYVTSEAETFVIGGSQWRYTLKIGNHFKRFLMWEEELTPLTKTI